MKRYAYLMVLITGIWCLTVQGQARTQKMPTVAEAEQFMNQLEKELLQATR